MSKYSKQLKEAREATEKLNAYSDGVYAAGSREATKKYQELNAKADQAIKKLPKHLRSRAAIELLK